MGGVISIGDAARRSGVKVPTIRYYEAVGLLPAPPRTEGNRRSFNPEDVRRLGFIRHARDLGFGLDAIRTLLALQAQPNQPCADADALARARLADVEGMIRRLTALKGELMAMIDSCDHRRVADCRVIEVLGDHSQCVHTDHQETAPA